MNLNLLRELVAKEYADSTVDLKEGVIPWHITMTLEQIVNSGKITNSVQTFVVAGLIEMFKNGGPHRWPREANLYEYPTMSTNSDMISTVRGLTAEEQKDIAQWLILELKNPAAFENNPCQNTNMGVSEWIQRVCIKRA